MNNVIDLATHFAPPGRATDREVARQAAEIESLPLVSTILDAIPEYVLILNGQRQVVFANRALLDKLDIAERRTAIGLRPGEALGCIHASEEEAGCGTSMTCCTCGAVKAIMGAIAGKHSAEECRISTSIGGGTSLDLLAWATPVDMADGQYVVFAAQDISDHKRRRALERIFFHDVLNTAGGLRGLACLLRDDAPSALAEMAEIINQGTNNLVMEIESQKALLDAENDELSVNPGPVNSLELLNQVIRRFLGSGLAEGKDVTLAPEAEEFTFPTDLTILGRILGNLLKNALEASAKGGQVSLSSRRSGAALEFTVHNPGAISPEVQLQIFKRSFSTKEASRGLGTYSVKLLTEKYLKGRVSFVSSEEMGTTFTVYLPRNQA